MYRREFYTDKIAAVKVKNLGVTMTANQNDL